jgi:dTDP-4-dehydrorhamnose 3,5-epimerase-like enzyme
MTDALPLVQWIELASHGDERGNLVVIEAKRDVPFDIKRVYYLVRTLPGVPRGFHAHRTLQQVLVSVAGSCTILLDNGNHRVRVLLSDPTRGLLVEPMLWHEMHDFSSDCVLLVLAAAPYDEADYVRSYEEFIQLKAPNPTG